MKRVFFLSVVISLCGLMFSSCAGGSKSGAKDPQYLGELPAIYEKFDKEMLAYYEKTIVKAMELMEKGETKNRKELMKLVNEVNAEIEAREKQLKADLANEVAIIEGTEIPLTYSSALLTSEKLFYDVSPIRIVAYNKGKTEIAISFSLMAKHDFKKAQYKDDFNAHYRYVAADGSTIATGTADIKKWQDFRAGDTLIIGTYRIPKTVVGKQIDVDKLSPENPTPEIKQRPKVAKIEFITKEEKEQYNKNA